MQFRLVNKTKVSVASLFFVLAILFQPHLQVAATDNLDEAMVDKLQMLNQSTGIGAFNIGGGRFTISFTMQLRHWPNLPLPPTAAPDTPDTMQDTCTAILSRSGMASFRCTLDSYDNPVVTGPYFPATHPTNANAPVGTRNCGDLVRLNAHFITNNHSVSATTGVPNGWHCEDLASGAMEFSVAPEESEVTYHIELSQSLVTIDRCDASPTANFTATLIRTEDDVPTVVDNPIFEWSFTENTTDSTVVNGLVTVGQTESYSELNLIVSELRATGNSATAVIVTYTDLIIPTTAHATFADPQTCEIWRVLIPNQAGNALIITEHVHGYATTWFDIDAAAYNWSGTDYHNTGTSFVDFEASTLFTAMQNWYQNSNNVGSLLRNRSVNYYLNNVTNLTVPTTGDSRIFILTAQEVETHFAGSTRRASIRQNVAINRPDVTTGWWIRTQSTFIDHPAQFVSYEILPLAIYHPEGIGFNTMQHEGVGFRPAMWINR